MKRIWLYSLLTAMLVSSSAVGDTIDSLRQLLEVSHGNERIDVLLGLSGHVGISDPTESEELANEALALSEAADYDIGRVNAWLRLATIYSRKGDYDQTELLATKALDLAEEITDLKGVTNAQLTLGSLYVMKSEYAKAFQIHLDGLKNAEKIPDRYLVRNFNMNLAIIKMRLDELDEAETYLKTVLDMLIEDGLEEQTGGIYINLAILEYDRDNYGKSIEYNKKALDIFLKTNERYGIALSLYNLGFGSELIGKDSEALDYFDRSIAIRKEIGDKVGVGKILLEQAKILKKLRSAEKAENLALDALQIAESAKDWELAKNTYEFLYTWKDEQGDSKKAYTYYKRFVAANDTLVHRANKEKFAELTAKHQVEELKRDKEIRDHEAEITRLKLKQRNATLVGVSAILLLTMVVFGFAYRRTKNQLDTNRSGRLSAEKESEGLATELAEEKRKLRVLANQLQLGDTVGDNLSEDAEGGKVETGNSDILRTKLNDGITTDKDWVAFNMLFDVAYPDFMERLKEKLVDPTINHVRLATLIKIQLSNKEIANIFNISRESVVRAKYRLREKLGLETNKEMEDYLQNL